jgi:hypothetical protein
VCPAPESVMPGLLLNPEPVFLDPEQAIQDIANMAGQRP